MSGIEQPEVLEIHIEEDEDQEETDMIAEAFRNTGDSYDVVIHSPDCATKQGGFECDCIPITLRRGAKA